MPKLIHAGLLEAEMIRMIDDDKLETRINEMFRLIEQNKRDYMSGHEACNAHAQELVDGLYDLLKKQLQIRFRQWKEDFATMDARITALENRKAIGNE